MAKSSTTNETRAQQLRIKLLFEKRNQKSTQTIIQLQQKLEKYEERLKMLQTTPHSNRKPTLGIIRGVGHGIKYVNLILL